MRAHVLIAVAGALLLAFASPAAAQDGALLRVFQDYADDGRIDPCKHSSGELRAVQRSMPPDVEQYAPDFPSAVTAALEARARGDCLRDGGADTGTAVPGGASPAATPSPTPAPSAAPAGGPSQSTTAEPPQPPPAPPGPAAAQSGGALQPVASAEAGNDVPLPVLLLALLAALLAAFALAIAVTRRLGWADGPWHAWREAAWRADGVWLDFRDWLRLGR